MNSDGSYLVSETNATARNPYYCTYVFKRVESCSAVKYYVFFGLVLIMLYTIVDWKETNLQLVLCNAVCLIMSTMFLSVLCNFYPNVTSIIVIGLMAALIINLYNKIGCKAKGI